MNYTKSVYQPLVSILKEGEERFDEDFVQRLWFEGLFKKELVTQTGDCIELLQPGFWNKQAGPDFKRVALNNEKGELEVGDVELHLRAEDWAAHRHDEDDAYENVVLHVVWKFGDTHFFAGTRSRRAIRQIELASQLRVPLQDVRLFMNTSKEERMLGARIGKCARDLEAFREEEVIELLHQAGIYRFQNKVRLWSVREMALGYEQALWLGLADALGYADNRAGFTSLARILPIADLLRIKNDVKREALLFGVAGFMPGHKLPKGAAESQWLRSLWDEWWLMRNTWDERVASHLIWKRSGIRPANRPERRLAVLAKISARKNWQQFVSVCKSADGKLVQKYLEEITHPFWDYHYSVQGAALPQKVKLVGESRIQAFLFNVTWTLGWNFTEKQPLIMRQLAVIRSTLTNQPARRAALRLLGERKNKKSVKSQLNRLLLQEGLLQVYRDFCLADASNCQSCDFPQWVEKFKSSLQA
ncbi:MAG: DUF2851 family protein [Verrucomicrobiota bacterium]